MYLLDAGAHHDAQFLNVRGALHLVLEASEKVAIAQLLLQILDVRGSELQLFLQ